MSLISTRVEKQCKRFRDTFGELVEFKGAFYRCLVEEVAGAKAGQQGVSQGTYGIYIAATVASIFDFNASDFAPTTDTVQPIEGDFLFRNGMVYIVTAYDFENIDTDTDAFCCYALRKIWPDAPVG